MSTDGFDGLDGHRHGTQKEREERKEPVSRSTSFSLGAENGKADTGRDGRSFFARPKSQTGSGTGKKSFSLFS